MKKRGFLAAVLIAGTLLAGCGSGSGSSVSNNSPASVVGAPATTRSQYGPLVFTLTVPKTTYNRGEVVPAVFMVTNTSNNLVDVAIGNPPPAYIDVKKDNNLIFSNSGGGAVVIYEHFAPGESKTYTFPWGQTQITPSNQMVGAGRYEIYARYDAIKVLEATKPALEPSANVYTLLGPPPVEVSVE